MNKWCLVLIFLGVLACSKKDVVIDDINLEKWKNDKFGCLGYRNTTIDIFQKSKDRLLKMSEVDIMAAFGKPDRAELIEKSQKIYAYYLNGNIDCSNYDASDSLTRILHIRFNSTGYANSLLVINKIKE
jgi:hypothetical protein